MEGGGGLRTEEEFGKKFQSVCLLSFNLNSCSLQFDGNTELSSSFHDIHFNKSRILFREKLFDFINNAMKDISTNRLFLCKQSFERSIESFSKKSLRKLKRDKSGEKICILRRKLNSKNRSMKNCESSVISFRSSRDNFGRMCV